MNAADRTFGWLLIIGSLFHAAGSIRVYQGRPEILLWAFSATLAGLFLAALNLLRVGRPGDKMLAWISFWGCLAWLAVAIVYGKIIGNLLDFRVVTLAAITIVLAISASVQPGESILPLSWNTSEK